MAGFRQRWRNYGHAWASRCRTEGIQTDDVVGLYHFERDVAVVVLRLVFSSEMSLANIATWADRESLAMVDATTLQQLDAFLSEYFVGYERLPGRFCDPANAIAALTELIKDDWDDAETPVSCEQGYQGRRPQTDAGLSSSLPGVRYPPDRERHGTPVFGVIVAK